MANESHKPNSTCMKDCGSEKPLPGDAQHAAGGEASGVKDVSSCPFSRLCW